MGFTKKFESSSFENDGGDSTSGDLGVLHTSIENVDAMTGLNELSNELGVNEDKEKLLLSPKQLLQRQVSSIESQLGNSADITIEEIQGKLYVKTLINGINHQVKVTHQENSGGSWFYVDGMEPANLKLNASEVVGIASTISIFTAYATSEGITGNNIFYLSPLGAISVNSSSWPNGDKELLLEKGFLYIIGNYRRNKSLMVNALNYHRNKLSGGTQTGNSNGRGNRGGLLN